MVEYSEGVAASYDDVVDAIEAVASALGWNTSLGNTVGGDAEADVGRTLELDWGNDLYVTVRSMENVRGTQIPVGWGGYGPLIDGPGITVRAFHGEGSELSEPPSGDDNEQVTSNYIGPQPFVAVNPNSDPLADGWVGSTFPLTYYIYGYSAPVDALITVVQTSATQFQWMMFGELIKFGTWVGGQFYGASGTARGTTSGASGIQPSFSVNGSSVCRSYMPFGRMGVQFSPQLGATTISNTRIYCVTGTSETDIDDYPWTHNAAARWQVSTQRAVREGVANIHWSPISTRHPNPFNQVAVMSPFWISTQRESHRVLIGRAPYIRHMKITNFNPGDTFELGNDTWQVFPYFEREGLTGLYGMAILRGTGSDVGSS